MRLVVLGGSATATPELIEAIDAWPGGPDRRPPLEVVLVGRDRQRTELVAAAARSRWTGTGPALKVSGTDEPERSLDGCDVVLQQVRIGGLTARAFDESFPRAFGLPGEETMGPGGFANALRTVPALRRPWAIVARLAPRALVIDLTNPAGIVTQAARREHGLQLVSVCDSPVTFLGSIAARTGRSFDDVACRYVGMNHLGWFVPEEPVELERLADVSPGIDPDDARVLGALPTAYTRYHLHPRRALDAQLGRPTRAEALQTLRERMLADFGDLAADGGAVPRRDARWYGLGVVPLLDAWVNGSPSVLVLGRRNGGLLDEVGPDTTVEIAHRVPAPGVFETIEPPARPPLVRAMLAAQGAYEDLTVEAALGDDPAARLRALVANPMVRDLDQAAGLLAAIERGIETGWGPVPDAGVPA